MRAAPLLVASTTSAAAPFFSAGTHLARRPALRPPRRRLSKVAPSRRDLHLVTDLDRTIHTRVDWIQYEPDPPQTNFPRKSEDGASGTAEEDVEVADVVVVGMSAAPGGAFGDRTWVLKFSHPQRTWLCTPLAPVVYRAGTGSGPTGGSIPRWAGRCRNRIRRSLHLCTRPPRLRCRLQHSTLSTS